MKKFNFRLTGFLKIKEFEEKNAWNEVLKQEGRVNALKRRIDTLIEAVHESRQQLSDPDMGPSTAGRWQLAEESIAGQTAQISVLEKEYLLEKKTLEKLIFRHSEIKKEAKIIDNYKARKKSEFADAKAKNEEIQRNEFATQSFLRKERKI
jgi:flagellar export protein FliJ